MREIRSKMDHKICALTYLIQAIYMKVEAEKALGETWRQHADPTT